VTAMVGTVRASKAITVTSPLVGLWVRHADDKDGMTVRVQASADGLSAYVVSAPGVAALKYLKEDISHVATDFALKCVQQRWPAAVKKWKSVRRLTATRWSLSDLSKPVKLFRNCNQFGYCTPPVCKAGKVEFVDNYELTLIDPNHAETRDSTLGADTIQRWERSTPWPWEMSASWMVASWRPRRPQRRSPLRTRRRQRRRESRKRRPQLLHGRRQPTVRTGSRPIPGHSGARAGGRNC
jgi:hypothetical protein